MTISEAEFRRLRRGNVGRLVNQLNRDFRRRALSQIQSQIRGDIRDAHLTVLIHLPTEGARLTDLAQRASITKQAMGQLVDSVAELGLVTRCSDPADRRAKLIVLTEPGLEFMRHAVSILKDIEADYAALIGRKRLETLRGSLLALLAAVDELPDH